MVHKEERLLDESQGGSRVGRMIHRAVYNFHSSLFSFFEGPNGESGCRKGGRGYFYADSFFCGGRGVFGVRDFFHLLVD